MTTVFNNSSASQKNTGHSGISLDILWVLVILAGFLFFVSLIPLPPNDFWWHIKIGEYIYHNHAIPTSNMYAWTLPADQPFFYAAWLGELLLYWLYHIGGIQLDVFIRTLLIGISFGLVANEARRRSGSWRVSALVVTLLCLMSTSNLPVRTQIWAWLPFIITYVILQRFSESKLKWQWLLFCPALMIFWVNVHGSYILGLALPFLFFGGQALSKLLKQDSLISWKQISWLGATGVISAVAILVNPRFTGIIQYAVNLISNQPIQQFIEEWQSPTPHGIANISFYVSVLVLIVIIAYSRSRLTITEVFLIIAFLWLAWDGQRSIIWYGIIVTPILARLVSGLPIRKYPFIPQRNWLNLVIVVLLFIPVLLVQPWFVEKLPLPATYWQQVLYRSPAGPLLSAHTPVQAAEYLRTHPGGHLYNEMGYGSYLIWALPEQKVFIDPRIELYPYEQWQDYIRINNGSQYDQILEKYGVDRILTDAKLQPELAASLSNDENWTLEWRDEYAEVWSKTGSR